MSGMRLFHRTEDRMKTFLRIDIVYTNEGRAKALLAEAFERADALIHVINAWDPTSPLAAVNRMAGTGPVIVPQVLFDLVERALKVCAFTEGRFDITFASMDRIWYFDRPMERLPTADEVRGSVAHVDYRHIRLVHTDRAIHIRNEGTKIELGAVGKGFICEQIKRFLQLRGVANGLVNAGGDLVAWGNNERDEPWTITVMDPRERGKAIGRFPITDHAVATSGDYERYVDIDGERYTHIIDPRTGWPVKGVRSVTITYPDAELADALCTAVFLNGVHDGLALIEQVEGLHGFIVDDHGEHHFSSAFRTEAIPV